MIEKFYLNQVMLCSNPIHSFSSFQGCSNLLWLPLIQAVLSCSGKKRFQRGKQAVFISKYWQRSNTDINCDKGSRAFSFCSHLYWTQNFFGRLQHNWQDIKNGMRQGTVFYSTWVMTTSMVSRAKSTRHLDVAMPCILQLNFQLCEFHSGVYSLE